MLEEESLRIAQQSHLSLSHKCQPITTDPTQVLKLLVLLTHRHTGHAQTQLMSCPWHFLSDYALISSSKYFPPSISDVLSVLQEIVKHFLVKVMTGSHLCNLSISSDFQFCMFTVIDNAAIVTRSYCFISAVGWLNQILKS